MNRIRAILHLSFRGYRGNRGGRTSAKRISSSGEMTMPQSEIFSENFGVDTTEDPEDLDEYESNFDNVATYDKMHEREINVRKSAIQTHIIKNKYFKSEDPPMLTWAEKEQIRVLYAKDPEQWSAERLSESFPATRDAIVRVLRAKWTPKYVKVVAKYDKEVEKNWESYKSGKLVVSPELAARLEKFKDRKIELMDPEEIAKKIIKQKPVFPLPNSQMFSSIIRSYQEANPASRDDEDEDDEINGESSKTSAKQITSGKPVVDDEATFEINARLDNRSAQSSQEDTFTFDEFLEQRVGNIKKGEISMVDRVLMDEYKKRKTESYRESSLVSPAASQSASNNNPDKTEMKKERSFVLESENPVGTSREEEEMRASFEEIMFPDEAAESDKRDLSEIGSSSMKPEAETTSIGFSQMTKVARVQEEKREQEDLMIANKGSLETGIICRLKKNDPLDADYPQYINIPPKKQKKGVTYRVEDRYYDDDGEFLYRIVGLKS